MRSLSSRRNCLLSRRPIVLSLMVAVAAYGCAHPSRGPERPSSEDGASAQKRGGDSGADKGVRPRTPGAAQVGLASYYGPGFDGRLTASGTVFRAKDLTCAHRSLPFGTRLRVTNLANGRSVLVTVTDRGPFVRGRMVDLSEGAARRLGFVDEGVARVKLEVQGTASD